MKVVTIAALITLTRSSKSPRFHFEELESEASVSLFVDCFEAQSLLEADASRFRRRDESQVADKEDPTFIDCLLLDSLQFAREKRGEG
jgi:hypothetical protein